MLVVLVVLPLLFVQAPKAAALDSKTQRQVRDFLDLRRHVHREGRALRVTKLLQDFVKSEENYVKLLSVTVAMKNELLGKEGIEGEDVAIVFGDVARSLDLHMALSQVARQGAFSELNTDPVVQVRWLLVSLVCSHCVCEARVRGGVSAGASVAGAAELQGVL